MDNRFVTPKMSSPTDASQELSCVKCGVPMARIRTVVSFLQSGIPYREITIGELALMAFAT